MNAIKVIYFVWMFFPETVDISSFCLQPNSTLKAIFDNGKSRNNLCKITSGRLLLLKKHAKILRSLIFRIKEYNQGTTHS